MKQCGFACNIVHEKHPIQKKRRFLLSGLVLCSVLCAANALGYEQDSCVVYRVVFDKIIEENPSRVALGKSAIGTITQVTEDQKRSVVEICIPENKTKHITKESLSYVDGKDLVLYTLWSDGNRLEENGSIQGFTSKIPLFIHELKMLFQLVLNKIWP